MKNAKQEKLKRLFVMIMAEKNKGKNLSRSMEEVSKKMKLKKESVKNYYYKAIKFLNENPFIANNLGIDLNINKATFKKFSKIEKEKLVKTISDNLKNGISIRQSCLMLANNNAKEMLRLQNKYRNIIKLNAKKVANLKQSNTQKIDKTEKDKNINKNINIEKILKNSNENNKNNYFVAIKNTKKTINNNKNTVNENILETVKNNKYAVSKNTLKTGENNKTVANKGQLSFSESKNKIQSKTNKNIININTAKQKFTRTISDSEINALFMGLVKIIKKNALENANEELKTECQQANENFRQTIIDLNKKESELKKVCKVNEELNKKITSQQQQICELLEKLSKRKLAKLEKQSNMKCAMLKNFNKTTKTDNIL